MIFPGKFGGRPWKMLGDAKPNTRSDEIQNRTFMAATEEGGLAASPPNE